MKPFRKNVALAVDGGGIRGVMVAQALAILEEHLGLSSNQIFRLTAGTSTGSIIAAGVAVGRSGAQMHRLYTELGETVFPRTLRSRLWPLTRYRYSSEPLERALLEHIGPFTMGELWTDEYQFDVVITVFDLVENRTRFIKPWKPDYADWPLVQAVLASCTVPTYFPTVAGRYVDGGVGSYSNPSYLAAYELSECLYWEPTETTLISLGTGRSPHTLRPGEADGFYAWNWIQPVLGAFLQSADDQQIHLVNTFFRQVDFRRFQVDLRHPIGMDDVDAIPLLTAYGEELARKIINDETDPVMGVFSSHPPEALPGRGW
ncbi:MAG TPA: patatin-like phospholipase family protein [Chloroflexi bacterium]|jgi:predicted acylesterase/phospholipase RssA|nr:patatin-like phospholipase family protein [Chloroflexota bacterium]